jgi:tRNA pseudouridine55 synthase
VDGFLLIDKPSGPSSFFAVKKARQALQTRKAGHSGALDPLATGLLICAVGKATRLLQYLPDEPKTYYFSVQFGSETDSLDSEGRFTAEGLPIPEKSALEAALPRFTGVIDQVPPRFSAIKISGSPAYKLARRGKDFTIPERKATIHQLRLERYEAANGKADFMTVCAGGTYVRSLVRDIAHALGSAMHVTAIRRTAMGPFSVEEALAFDTLAQMAAASIIAVEKAFAHHPTFTVNEKQKAMLLQGRDIAAEPLRDKEAFFLDQTGKLIALGRRTDNSLYHPVLVLALP